MSQAYIKQIVTDVITRFQTRNPAEIARALEIGVKYADIGALKGFYTVIMETPFIVLNQNISEEEQRTILAHELGHHLLHEHLVQQDGIRETVLYDLSSQPEYEANVFSAHLLLDPK
ncbi:MAG: ImmA/IrrE family metallo-endopeptidase, partial [Clostridia bacterium]|nr:ImmA/IrrE family metallo-endopeptidase [Clostridia bacterium]